MCSRSLSFPLGSFKHLVNKDNKKSCVGVLILLMICEDWAAFEVKAGIQSTPTDTESAVEKTCIFNHERVGCTVIHSIWRFLASCKWCLISCFYFGHLPDSNEDTGCGDSSRGAGAFKLSANGPAMEHNTAMVTNRAKKEYENHKHCPPLLSHIPSGHSDGSIQRSNLPSVRQKVPKPH